MALVSAKRAGVELHVVGGVVAVDVGVFEHVGFRIEDVKVPDGVAHDVEVGAAEGARQARPRVRGVEGLDRVGYLHCWVG